jgi:glycosyltransferase involved in cell wall biosynthesis
MAALGHRCFYLNPNLGRQFPYPVRHRHDRLKVCTLSDRIWEIHSGLPAEPVFHHRLLDPPESNQVARDLAGVCKAFGSRRLIVISQFPLWNQAIDELKRLLNIPQVLVYDCHDWLAGFSGIFPEILAAEEQLFRQADVVVFSAKSLLEKQLSLTPWLGEKASLVRNAVDAKRFAVSTGSPGPRRVAGYVGAIEEWFDVEAVAAAATAHPDCDFVFLGRVENKAALALQSQHPNVRFYGEIPYDRIPVYLQQFDIALIPFLVNDLTLATNPIKLYEYFSCGLPVVSSALPEVAQFGELAYIAGSASEFGEKVGQALAERSPDLRQQRIAIAGRESWQARAEEVLRAAAGQMPAY